MELRLNQLTLIIQYAFINQGLMVQFCLMVQFIFNYYYLD